MSSSEPEQEPTRVDWLHIDVEFKHDVDLDALFAALELPEDVLAHRSIADTRSDEDTLVSRFRAWGWGTNINVYSGPPQPLLHIGVYYDFTTLEDDERFMPAIAPFVESGSKAIFKLHDAWGEQPEGWDFQDGTVTRRKVEVYTEYEFL